jgi:hypothetical protein
VIETRGPKTGGRGKVASYANGTAKVVAAVVRAKSDDTYKRKLYRAVLIAWAREASIGTEGLRWAFREHFKAEENKEMRRLQGVRVEEDEPDLHFPPEFNRALAAAKTGAPMGSEFVGTFERLTGPRIAEVMRNGPRPDLLPRFEDETYLGLASRRSDGTWRVSTAGNDHWEGLTLRPRAEIAKSAPRGELDAARRPMRAMFKESGFDPSDLVVANSVPEAVRWMRKWYGDQWWHRRR